MYAPIDKLQKFLKLEIERGYDNRAVVGGLDKILPSWEKEARSLNIEDRLIQDVSERLQGYQQLDTNARASHVVDLQNLLQDYLQAHPAEVEPPPAVQRKPQTRPSHGDTSVKQSAFPEPRSVQSSTPGNNRPRKPSSIQPEIQGALGLNAPLTVIPGIGPRHAQSLETLGLNTLGDLLYYFPRRYDDYSKLKPINRLEYKDELTVIGTVQSAANRPLRGGQQQLTEVIITDGTGFLRLNWFNQPWLANQIHAGDQIVLSGRIDMYLGRLVMNNPEWEQVDQQHLHTNRITPIYPLTARVTQRWLRRIMYQTVTFWAPRQTDYLPESIRTAASLVDLQTALIQAHFPDNDDALKSARTRLAFDEIFFLQLGVLQQKRSWQSVDARVFPTTPEWLEYQVAALPFSLTGAQQEVLRELSADLASGRPMNRLLQGDVGSGKTVIAALATAIVTSQEAQAAFMAPTSILAEQHYRTLLRLLTSQKDENTPALLNAEQIRLLVGDTPESNKQEIRAGLADGSIRLVIGTHALIENPVEFQQLQLVVIDEQHRFGVAQRAALRSKGQTPHLLVMTATPIPRSLALTVYGDLDLSVMDEMPSGRLPIETHVLRLVERERAYQLISTQVAAGHQAFIIYPLVEQGENDEGKAAVEEHDRLQREVFPHLRLGLMHGRLRPDEKEAVMAQFRDGQFQILVSTSVVEVGVDVPNATVMLIEGANRFGLAQLHQFRGRVGRGEDQSYCLLIPETDDAFENERLVTMEETNDGFVLAERDLQQRGPGDFLGTRQAGFAELRMANLSDVHLIEIARQQARQLFDQDPEFDLPENVELFRMMGRFWGNGRGDVS